MPKIPRDRKKAIGRGETAWGEILPMLFPGVKMQLS
jgi:hypothetical protein